MSADSALRRQSFSVDIGGSSVRVASGSSATGLTAERAMPLDRSVSAEHVLDFVATSVQELRKGGVNAASLAVSFPGLLTSSGEVLAAPNLSEDWAGVSPGRWLQERTGLTVLLANDARAATVGEFVFGEAMAPEARSTGTMAYLGLGTGVGGGLVINGRLHVGASGSAGELGHMVIERYGKACACGGRGCVETLAGGAALVEAGGRLIDEGEAPVLEGLLSAQAGRIDVRLIAEAAAAGDRAVSEVLDEAARALGVLIANLTTTISPETVVLGGGISALGERLVQPIWAEVRERVHMVSLDTLNIACSALGDKAGLLGGLVLAESSADQRSPFPVSAFHRFSAQP